MDALEVVNAVTGDEESGLTPSYNVKFPGGNVQIIQTTDGDYWVHIGVNRTLLEGEHRGLIKAARLDCEGKSVFEMDVGDFNNPGLYHLGILIAPGEKFENDKLLKAKKGEKNMSACPSCGRYTEDDGDCVICRGMRCRCCGGEFYDSPPPESDIVCNCDTGSCPECGET